MLFKKYAGNPVIPIKSGSFRSIHAANPDLLEFNDKLFLYYRGQGDSFHDQIGVAWCEISKFNGIDWNHFVGNPVIKVSKDKDAFDSRHILDPGSVVLGDKVFLYYSGHSYDKPACIGLAVSSNGVNYVKNELPVIQNAIAPEVVLKDGLVHLFYQKKISGRFVAHKCTSYDGYVFDIADEKMVLSPEDDEFSVSTCRIWQEDDTYYMIYGMCRRFDDYPEAFGLTKSYDLENWQRYPGNPVMERGKAGTWDEGAIWFGTVHKANGKYYLWYEGAGSSGADSELCRNHDYGGYAKSSFSQVGMAVHNASLPTW